MAKVDKEKALHKIYAFVFIDRNLNYNNKIIYIINR